MVLLSNIFFLLLLFIYLLIYVSLAVLAHDVSRHVPMTFDRDCGLSYWLVCFAAIRESERPFIASIFDQQSANKREGEIP